MSDEEKFVYIKLTEARFCDVLAVLSSLYSICVAANGSNEYAYQSAKLMLSKSCHGIE
jgi:hypothetical protein